MNENERGRYIFPILFSLGEFSSSSCDNFLRMRKNAIVLIITKKSNKDTNNKKPSPTFEKSLKNK